MDGAVGPGDSGRGTLRERSVSRSLLEHPVIRILFFERFLVTASATLALAAIAMGHVRLSEVPGLMDVRILTLFFVLTVSVELGKVSDLFDRLVETVVARVRSARGLAFAMIGATAVLAALLTNDVALFLVVPFTMLFQRVDVERAPLIVLEVLSANLLGAVTPIGNPQNLFLYARGGFTVGSFAAAQLPVAGLALLFLAGAVWLLVPRRALAAPPRRTFSIDISMACGFVVLLAVEIASLVGPVSYQVPLVLALPGLALLGRRMRDTDFSLVFVFAFLFIGVPGLERGPLYHFLDPERLFGHGPIGLLFSGAVLSQLVSNVPAALLLAPAAASAPGFRGLLYGVTVGACGSPVGSVANLIGAQIYVAQGGRPRAFWRLFCAVSGVFAIALLLFAVLLLTIEKH